jgi:hypothetical protein
MSKNIAIILIIITVVVVCLLWANAIINTPSENLSKNTQTSMLGLSIDTTGKVFFILATIFIGAGLIYLVYKFM